MDEKLREEFAKNLKICMDAAGKKQIDLCQYMQVSSATASDWCNGVKLPRLDKIVSIANWLNVDLSELVSNQQKKVAPAFAKLAVSLNDEGKKRLFEYAKFLSLNPEYKATEKVSKHES